MQALQDAIDQVQQSLNSRQPRRNINSMDLHPFSGRSDENLNLWLDRFNRYGQAYDWSDDDKRKILPALLRDAAEVIFNGIPVAQRTAMSFDDLVDALRQRFNPAHSAEVKSSQLHTRKQLPG